MIHPVKRRLRSQQNSSQDRMGRKLPQLRECRRTKEGLEAFWPRHINKMAFQRNVLKWNTAHCQARTGSDAERRGRETCGAPTKRFNQTCRQDMFQQKVPSMKRAPRKQVLTKHHPAESAVAKQSLGPQRRCWLALRLVPVTVKTRHSFREPDHSGH